MIVRIFTMQFAKDGLIGVVTVLVVLSCLFVSVSGALAFFEVLEPFMGFIATFPQESLINPLPFILCVAFVGSGVGGLFTENASTHRAWADSILFTLLTTCGVGIVIAPLFLAIGLAGNPLELLGGLLFGGLFSLQIICPSGICLSIFGFFPLWAVAALTKPKKYVYKTLMGAFASSILGIGMGSLLLIMPLFFA